MEGEKRFRAHGRNCSALRSLHSVPRLDDACRYFVTVPDPMEDSVDTHKPGSVTLPPLTAGPHVRSGWT